MAKKDLSERKFTVTAAGLIRILDVLNDELNGGPDGFVTAELFPDGGVSIRSKDGRLLMHDDIEIKLENDRG
jgi:hypothetical protein